MYFSFIFKFDLPYINSILFTFQVVVDEIYELKTLWWILPDICKQIEEMKMTLWLSIHP